MKSPLPASARVVVGVDTRKDLHVAAAIDEVMGAIAMVTVASDTAGIAQLAAWAEGFGKVVAFASAGTGSYGSAVASYVRRHGHKVVEVSRPDRRLRRLHGKSDTLDGENAAKAVLSGVASAVPKTADGTVERIRQPKVTNDTAVKKRSATLITPEAMLVHASETLKTDTAGKTPRMLTRHLAALRPRAMDTPDDSNRHVLRSLARRWQALNEETPELGAMI